MNQYKLAEYDYLEAKTALKKDFKIFTVLAVIFVVAFACIAFIFLVPGERLLLRIALSILLGVIIGLEIVCGVIGLIEGLKFAWNTFEWWSLVLMFIVIGISFGMGFLITLVKFLKGYFDVRKLEKTLYGNS